jgi:hypothetical protein
MDNAVTDGYKVINNHFYGIGVGVDFEFFSSVHGFVEIPLTFQSSGEISMLLPQLGVFYHF